MAKCKECVYEPMCYKIEHFGRDLETDEACNYFRDAAKIIDLPFKIGDNLYFIKNYYQAIKYIVEITVKEVTINSRYSSILVNNHYFYLRDDIGKTIFFSREAAEKALKERDPLGH